MGDKQKGQERRAFPLLKITAIKTFSEEEVHAPNIPHQAYIFLGNIKISQTQKKLIAIKAVLYRLLLLGPHNWILKLSEVALLIFVLHFNTMLVLHKNKCIIVHNLLLSTTNSPLSATLREGLSRKQARGKGEENSSRRLLPDISFMNNLTIQILQWLENVIIKYVHNSRSCFLGNIIEAAGPAEKPMSEIPLLCYLSFLHSPFEEKRKGCGRFKCWKLLFLSVILFGQWGCQITNTRPRTWELLLCTTPHAPSWNDICVQSAYAEHKRSR